MLRPSVRMMTLLRQVNSAKCGSPLGFRTTPVFGASSSGIPLVPHELRREVMRTKALISRRRCTEFTKRQP
jgi:hypothetical protein